MSPISPEQLRVVFVCGNSRSGTTMMNRILGRHPDVHGFRELHFFEQRWTPSDPAPGLPRDQALAYASGLLAIEATGHRDRSDPADFLADADRALGDVAHTAPSVYAAAIGWMLEQRGSEVGCDQTPRNVYFLPELLDLFPRAHAVIMVRDPRDVMLSQKNRWNRARRGTGSMSRRESLRLWAGYHPMTSTRLWNSGAAAGARVVDHPRVSTVHFADLVTDPHRILPPLFTSLGLSYEASVIDVPRIGSSHGPTDRVGLDPAAAGRWRMGGLTDLELAICDERCGPLMERYGFEPSGARSSAGVRAASGVSLAVKLILAAALNAGRVGNPVRAARRRFGVPA